MDLARANISAVRTFSKVYGKCTDSYLEVPPSSAISETSMFSGNLEDLNYRFYALTSILALAPILHTTAKRKEAGKQI